MRNSAHILQDLVSACRDGRSFYEQAARAVDDIGLKTLFTRIANAKGAIVQGLAVEASTGGDIPLASGTMAADFDKLYGEVRARLPDRNYAYLSRLEESEDHLLEALEKAQNDKNIPANARIVINRLAPEIRDCRDLLRARKIELRKAA